MPKRRITIQADPQFEKLANKAIKAGTNFTIRNVHIYPPRNKNAYWRVFVTFRGAECRLSAGKSIDEAYSAFCSAVQWLEERQNGVLGTPENSNHKLANVLTEYLFNGGSNYAWKSRTRKDRTRDLRGLIQLATKLNLDCAEFNFDHLRTFVNESAGTSQRGAFLVNQVKTFLEWGFKTGYFTHEQVLMAKRVQWTAPSGSNYKTQPTRRQQSQQSSGSIQYSGGEVPTHEQVIALADICQQNYIHGRALIHVAANTGLRASELFLLTASLEVAQTRKGNLVDLEHLALRVNVQINDDPNEPFKTTKNGKSRSVVIPPVELIQSGFDIAQWLQHRTQEALNEQAQGTNPLALIFPNAKGGVWDVNNFGSRVVGPAADELGWKMPSYKTAKGQKRSMRRFTLHSMRDRFATTAVEEWGYAQTELLDQGSWADLQTVQKYYIGTTDKTMQSVRDRLYGTK